MSPGKARKIAFDWDGTLVDCRARQTAVLAGVWKDSWSGVAMPDFESVVEIKTRRHEYAQSAGETWHLRRKCPESSGTMAARNRETRNGYACDAVFPDALAALEKVVANGCPAVIVTARTIPGNVRDQIAKLNIAALISNVYSWLSLPRRANKKERGPYTRKGDGIYRRFRNRFSSGTTCRDFIRRSGNVRPAVARVS